MSQIDSHKLISQITQLFEFAYGQGVPEAQKKNLYSQLQHLLLTSLCIEQKTEYRQVTILLSDLRGFTSLSEKLEPKEVIQLLNRYFDKMSEIVFRYGGTIDKFMGDAIMVLFGAPEIGNDDLLRAIACAVDMQLAMDGVNKKNEEMGLPPIFMGIGINTGEVVAGTVGSELYREYTVIGDQVNLVSRIEAHSLRGQILLSENSYNIAGDQINTYPSKEVMVKGKTQPVKLYELKSTCFPELKEVPSREIRNSPRIKVDMPMVFQVVDGKSIKPEHYEARILDISYSGLLAIMPFKPTVLMELKFSIMVSLLSQKTTDIYAKVIRVKQLEKGYECSVEFTSVDDAGMRAIHNYIDPQIA